MLLTVAHLYEHHTTENFEVKLHGNNTVITDKRNGERIMYEDRHTMNLYETSLENLNVHGDILIVGLGFGLLPFNFKQYPNVGKITCIEVEQEVIDIVNPVMPWIEFICADAYTYEPDGREWDTTFLDIFHKLVPEYREKQTGLIHKYRGMTRNDNVEYLRIHKIELSI